MKGILIDANEAMHLVISVVAISVGFTLAFVSPGLVLVYPGESLLFMVAVLVTVGSGFILHEMGHKLTAIYYGAQARFIMSVQGLIFTLATSLFGVLLALPGATYILTPIKPREYGITSLAGPMINVALTFFFLALDTVAPVRQFFSFLYTTAPGLQGFGIVGGTLMVWRFGAAINIWLGLFNMIPALILDGSKVYRWNKWLWMGLTAFMLFLGASIIGSGIIVTWVIITFVLLLLSKFLFG